MFPPKISEIEKEYLENKKKWCWEHKRVRCNLECPYICELHPEYKKKEGDKNGLD